MSEGCPKILKIEAALTNEEVKKQVQEGLKLSLEERNDVQKALMQQLQHQPTIKLTPEEIKNHRAAKSLGGETAK